MVRLQRDEDHLPVTGETEANGTGHSISLGDTAPSGISTSTTSKWLKVVDDGTTYYIPMWT